MTKEKCLFKKTLIIDDDMIGNTFFGKISRITNLTKDLLPIKNSIDAVDYLKSIEENEKPDAIFIDIEMPIMDGWEVLENIKGNRQLQDCNIFMITNGNNIKDEEKAKRDERVVQLLHKPLSLNILKHIKHQHIDKAIR